MNVYINIYGILKNNIFKKNDHFFSLTSFYRFRSKFKYVVAMRDVSLPIQKSGFLDF